LASRKFVEIGPVVKPSSLLRREPTARVRVAFPRWVPFDEFSY